MKNINKIIRRELLKEADETDARRASINFTNDGLAMAYRAGCFRPEARPYTPNGSTTQVAYVTDSKAIPGYPIVYFYPPEGNKGKLEFYKEDNKTKLENRQTNWTCDELSALTQDSMNPELGKVVDAIREAGVSLLYQYGSKDVADSDKVNGNCTLVNLKDIPQIQNRGDVQRILPKVVQAVVWSCKQQEGGSVTANKEVLTNLGFHVCSDAELVSGAASVEVKKVGDINYCKPKTGGASKIKNNPIYAKLAEVGGKIADGDVNEDNCKQLMDNYELAADKALPIPSLDIETAKNNLRACLRDKTLKMDGFLSKKYKKLQEKLMYYEDIPDGYGGKISYRLSTATSSQPSQIRESVRLKSVIRENLLELSDLKKKVLTEENNIIVNRFSVITEGVVVKSKKSKSKLVDDLVSESFLLNSQGFNQTLINEQFWDMIKSFFGNTGSGVAQMIGERIAKTIIEAITPLDPNGWVANIIITTVGNIPVGDYFNGKIFSCDYISDKLSKGIVEGMVRKIQNEKGMEGPIYDIFRNMLVETAEHTEFGTKIENMLGDLVCPSLSKVKEKMDSTSKTMKEKALAPA